MGYFEVLRTTLIDYGLPDARYTDKAGICFVNTKKQENGTVEDAPGWGKSWTRPDSVVSRKNEVYNTLQTKDQIERRWGTLQDHFPVWFKLNGITTLEAANRFIAKYNACRKPLIPPSSRSSLMRT
jgi:hypothetical protein